MMLTVSIVSHNNLQQITNILGVLLQKDFQVILTINVNEDLTVLNSYNSNNLKTIINETPNGFGENHNNALKNCKTKYCLILNPDVEIELDTIENLLNLMNHKVRVISPLALSQNGKIQDNARRYPSWYTPLLRILNLQSGNLYKYNDKLLKVDWISGMFILLETELFHQVKGFDQKFFLYYEDVDLCKRIKKNNIDIFLSSNITVVHEGERKSRKNLKYLILHLKSYLYYHLKHGWFSE